ncbi:hypothetical protein FDP41_011225 [Naegleria fowleri]|uniref:Uncharacterized protein n=1 Tax=Naegleria fowleri TaxID=5763 RepID=A0A6A5CA95_NAEFO|nr:uncharacterized protein FDP41_011225 [Naegleria fowleri]KAF0982295.1 hypothetical protein FDP41_011225 [Naegleria fowleri]CAG4711131.1 unnamed protein product [Naegleria fowleri]
MFRFVLGVHPSKSLTRCCATGQGLYRHWNRRISELNISLNHHHHYSTDNNNININNNNSSNNYQCSFLQQRKVQSEHKDDRMMKNSTMTRTKDNPSKHLWNHVSNSVLSQSSSTRSFSTFNGITNIENNSSSGKKRNFKSYRQPNSESYYFREERTLLSGEKPTLVGRVLGVAWKIITFPLKIISFATMGVLFFIGRLVLSKVLKKDLKQMELMFTRMTLKDAAPLKSFYRMDNSTAPTPTFMDPLTQQYIEVDPILEKCLKFVDNDHLVYDRLKTETVKHSGMKDSLNVTLMDAKEKTDRDMNPEAIGKLCFRNSTFLKLLTDVKMINAQSTPEGLVRDVPLFVMKKLTEKEEAEFKNYEQKDETPTHNEHIAGYKFVFVAQMHIYATYVNGQWQDFQKIDIVVQDEVEEQEEVLMTFDDLSTSEYVSTSSSSTRIMDAEFEEKK